MKYAIINIAGQQLKVKEGDTIKVHHLKAFEPKVLAFFDGNSLTLGKPFLTDITIKGSITGEEKGDKLRIGRFKAKSRYSKTTGYRSLLSIVKIEEIGAKDESAKKAKAPKVADTEVEEEVAAAPSKRAKKG